MAIQDIGMFLPAESQYKSPGAYDEALRDEAAKRAQYLSLMDQFYEQLNESQRQFNETLGFKTATRDLELAQAKWTVEQNIGLEEKRLAQEKYQFTEDLALRKKMLEAETEYRQESLDVERMKINANAPMNYLGTYPAEKSQQNALDALSGIMSARSRSEPAIKVWDSYGTSPTSGNVALSAADEAEASRRGGQGGGDGGQGSGLGSLGRHHRIRG